MKADLHVGPFWLAPLKAPHTGAVLGVADACGDVYMTLSAQECRRLGAALYRLSRSPSQDVGPQDEGLATRAIAT
jgi:hypothetical protein